MKSAETGAFEKVHPPAKDRRPCRIHSLFLIGLQVHLTEVGRAYIFDFKKTLLNVEILLKPDSSDTSVIVRSGFLTGFGDMEPFPGDEIREESRCMRGTAWKMAAGESGDL